ncbi:MAG: hypothetical protein QOF02_2532 [Blastocatellia bacterium]|nr:hypothetical protein [Blastocatellia bacterium]
MAPMAAAAARERSQNASSRNAERQQKQTTPETQRSQTPARLAAPAQEGPSAVNIVATKDDSFPVHPSGKAEPGDIINYTVNITNSGTTDATGVTFNDTVDTNTTFVGNSAHAQPQARNEAFTTVGNTLLEAGLASPSGAPAVTSAVKLFDNDAIATDTIQLSTFQATSANGGTVTVNADGSFSYLPAVGFTGSDTFTYTIRNSAATTPVLTDTATVTITVSNKVWYVNNSGANGDGRSSSPFNSLTPVNGAGGAGDPDAAGDVIYIFTGGGNYTTGIQLENNQQLIGNGVALVVGGNTLRVAGSRPTITNGAGNGVTLANTNTLSGFNIGDTSAIDISGNAFGTLTANNITLAGTGRPLSLTTGAVAATFDSITATSASGGQGISLTGVTGSLTSTSGTSITSPTTQCILVGTTTAAVNFGNTSCSGGTDGVSFQSNSSGTRTFGTLSVSGGSGSAFLSGAGGGNVTVTGAATLSSTGNPIDIQNMTNGSAISFAGTTVSKTTAGGAGINWGGTNTGATLGFASLGLTTSNGAGLVAAGGGTINVTTGTISATGSAGQAAPAINANGVTFGATFTSVSSTNSGSAGNGISLTGVLGTLTMSGGAISGAAGDAFLVSGGTANITYNGTIGTTAARPVNVSSKTGGTVAFGGAVSSTSNGVSLTTNTGATINFTGGLSLSTGANTAFAATGGGTVSATQNNTSIVNTLTATTGSALNVNATTIGASNLTFRSITSNGSGSNNGIILDNTGTNGGLIVTGNGGTCTSAATCTGGTIANKTGTDSQTTSGIGIYLNNTSNVSLDRMQLNDFQNFAILGTTVRGFTLTNSIINGTNGTNENVDEGSVAFTNLIGSATITNVNVSGSIEDNFRVINNLDRNVAGNALNRITFTQFTCGANSTTLGDNGLFIQAQLNSEVDVTIQNSTFTSARGDIFQFDLTNTAKGDLVLQNSAISNNHPAIVVGGGGVTLSGGGSTNSNVNFTYDINTNSFRDARGDLLLIALQTGGGLFSGKIRNNTFGVAAVDKSGGIEATSVELRTVGSGDQVVQIDNNQIRQYGNFGILLQVGGQVANGDGTTGTLNATVTNNTINTPSTFAFIKNGFQLNSGTNAGDAFQVCLNLSGNTLAGSGQNGGTDFQLRNRFSTTDRLPGYAGANNNNAAVVAFIQGQNAGGPTGTASNNVAGGSGGFVGGAACTTPAFVQPATPESDTDSAPAAIAPTEATKTESAPSMLDAPTSLSSGRPFISSPRMSQPPASSAPVAAPQPAAQAPARTAPAKTAAPETPTANFPVSVGTLQAGESVTIVFQVTLNDPLPGNVTQVSNQGTVSGSNFSNVLTDDPATGTAGDPTITPVVAFAFIVSDVSIAEGAVGQRQAVFTVSLTNQKSTATSVHAQTADGTATAGVDYVALPDTLVTIPANTSSTTVTVLVNGDTIFEGNEDFFVNLSTATGASILDSSAIGIIADDEPQVSDLSGDGLTDAAIWNSNNGNWFVVNSGTSTTTMVADDWGRASLGDIAVPGDYDFDNRIDIAVFRPSEGNWYILKSNNGTQVISIQNWGQSGDVPVPGDFDGDGRTDLAVWRPTNGNWYILKSNNGAPLSTVQSWGNPTDKPVVGDFDGDGKSDLAVFRPAEGKWYIINSATNTLTIQAWGVSTDKLVPGDFDGDGKTDLAVYRNGTWFIRNSKGGASTIKSWGETTDLAVPGDYDGDGKFDISVWRPGEGKFYTIRSSDNTVLLQTIELGGAGIKPVPNAYLPQ